MTKGELFKRIGKEIDNRMIDHYEYDEKLKMNIPVSCLNLSKILDEAKKEMPTLEVIGGLPLWEDFFKAEGEWRKKWFGGSP